MDGKQSISDSPAERAPVARKRVILSMGGKGGVGKTSVMSGLAEFPGEFDSGQAAGSGHRKQGTRVVDPFLRRSGA